MPDSSIEFGAEGSSIFSSQHCTWFGTMLGSIEDISRSLWWAFMATSLINIIVGAMATKVMDSAHSLLRMLGVSLKMPTKAKRIS